MMNRETSKLIEYYRDALLYFQGKVVHFDPSAPGFEPELITHAITAIRALEMVIATEEQNT
jgi:hypothetical protein